MHSIWQDLRFGARVLVKGRWITLAAMTALALGIGANNAVFTIVNAVLLRDLPFEEPDRIMWLDTRDARGRTSLVSLLDFADWKAASRSFSDLAIMITAQLNLSDEDRASESYPGVYISPDAFRILRVQPIMGRTLTAEDDRIGAPAVVVLGSSVWKTRYGADPSILGRTIRVSALPATVVGVMPDGMKFPFNAELWLAMSQVSEQTRTAGRQVRAVHPVFGRLADGVTLGQARAEMAAIGAQLARSYPDTNKDMVPVVTPYMERFLGPQLRLVFWSLMGAVGFVLLIACANVANLLLARAAHRSREVSVRVALGATRWRIVRQLLVESVLLAIVSGVLGLALSLFGIRWFDAATQNINKPYWMVFTLDVRVFVFFAIVCLATGIVFGLVPALHISKTNVNEVLKEGGRSGAGGVRARRWTGALIVTELVLTLVLLAGAGFMMRSFLVLYRMDLGIDTSRMLMMSMSMPRRKYSNTETRLDFLRRLDERLSAISAVGTTTTASNPPFGFGLPLQLTIDGLSVAAGEQTPTVTLLSVGPRYFETLGLRLLRGRAFADADGTPGHESAIVNRRFVDLHLAGDDPIGKRIRLTPETPLAAGLGTASQASWLTIVGVVPNVRQRAFQDPEPDAVAYVPHLGNSYLPLGMMLIVRAPGEPGKVTPLLREAIKVIDPDMPVGNVQTMDQFLELTRWFSRVFGTMFATFAGIALLLSAVGLYAVTAYSVTQRTQEIGVRMALGAEPRQVWWLILRRGLVQLAIGLTLGVAGALGVGRLLRSQLVQVGPADPITLASIVIVLVVVAANACLWPARHATRLDPAKALRYE